MNRAKLAECSTFLTQSRFSLFSSLLFCKKTLLLGVELLNFKLLKRLKMTDKSRGVAGVIGEKSRDARYECLCKHK